MGLATAQVFISSGWRVFGVDLSPAPSSITSANFQFLQIDITQQDAPKKIVSSCQKSFGSRIDALLNIAGIIDRLKGVDSLPDEEWDKIIAVNLTAPVRLMREVVNVMKEQKSGCIINVSSKAGISGAAGGVAYTAAKHGIVGATKNTAWIYKDEDIRCNAICPGAVVTNIMPNSGSDPSRWDKFGGSKIQPIIDIHVPDLAHTLDASYPANLMFFLVSDAAKGVNGAIVPIDNAWSVI
ncbi:NAD(P)-binding protein [Dendrothele bispora CBS 962.96]|uniref:NAD(P)-binding protein n=1 Tax=Dendrothele bispora (strain CBS 962.96) TaxID=1314807 RepID=A0A4S8MSY4_DENBC|nr:NAD(P)-binding protein [Dendrothele bispora CBS 962.96]